MKRLTPDEAAAWRARSQARYQERRKATSRAEKLDTPQRAKRRRELAVYRVTRAQRFVQARGQCEWVVFSWARIGGNPDAVCYSAATEAHHVVKRKSGGRGVDHSVENLRALCPAHHAFLHANEAWARENGWIRTEWPQLDSAGAQA